MAIINGISPTLEKALYELYKINDSTFDRIVKSLNIADASIHPTNLAEKISPEIKDVSTSVLQNIFFGIAILWQYKKNEDFTLENLVDDLMRLVNENTIKKIKFENKNDANVFKDKLFALLKNKNLTLSQSVADIYYDHDKLYQSGDIKIDIRPLIEDGGVEFAILRAELRLDYRCQGKTRSIYMGIDRSDIKILKNIIQSAEHKIAVFESTLKKAGLKEIKE